MLPIYPELVLEKSKQNSRRTGLGSLLGAYRLQTDDAFDPALGLSLIISYSFHPTPQAEFWLEEISIMCSISVTDSLLPFFLSISPKRKKNQIWDGSCPIWPDVLSKRGYINTLFQVNGMMIFLKKNVSSIKYTNSHKTGYLKELGSMGLACSYIDLLSIFLVSTKSNKSQKTYSSFLFRISTNKLHVNVK